MDARLDPSTLAKRLADSGLEQYSRDLVPLLKPSIGIVTEPSDESTLSLGTSKFGGSPDLPHDEKWPELYSYALDFIAQIKLTDVAAYDVNHQLPSSGILYFFHNESALMTHASWFQSKGRVLYYDGPWSALERRQAPQHQYYTACRLTFVPDANLPTYQDLIGDGVMEEMPTRDREAYEALRRTLSVVSYKESKANRLLGYPDHVQGSPLAEADTMVKNQPPAEACRSDGAWSLLLQVDSDSNANMFWGDYGTLYFCILNDDLQHHRFNRVMVFSQST